MHSATLDHRLQLLIVGSDTHERGMWEFIQCIDELFRQLVVKLRALVDENSIVLSQCGWRTMHDQFFVASIDVKASMNSLHPQQVVLRKSLAIGCKLTGRA